MQSSVLQNSVRQCKLWPASLTFHQIILQVFWYKFHETKLETWVDTAFVEPRLSQRYLQLRKSQVDFPEDHLSSRSGPIAVFDHVYGIDIFNFWLINVALYLAISQVLAWWTVIKIHRYFYD